jgi:prepilin-type N-terminal cleavage/methylation domain-containing protein
MNTKNLRRPRGFTLVELLVVIAIIGVLAAILIPTLYRVVVKARQNVIAQELNQLHLAIESYKQKFGDYPPDFTTLTSVNDFNAPTSPNQPHLVVRHIRKAFPRHAYTLGSGGTLAACFKDTSGNFVQPDPAEALVLWLSQVRDDPRQPLSGTSNRIVLFPFDEKRLVDPDGNGLYSYLPPSGQDAPYVYFDSRIYTDDSPISGSNPPLVASLCVYKDSAGTALLYPYASKVNASAALSMANQTTYQLISAGLDGEYGDVTGITAGTASTYKVFPFGTNYAIGDMDNLANFSDGKIFEDLLE